MNDTPNDAPHGAANDAPRSLLSDSNVRLDAVRPDDLPVMARWQLDNDFLRRYDAEAARPQPQQALANAIAEAQKDPTAYVFAIRLADHAPVNSAPIGLLHLDGILWPQGVGWLSLAIGEREQRGRGHGFAACALALDFAFDELNLRRVQLTVFSYNAPAIRLYEKLGFTHEGTYREFLMRDGQPHDMLLYGLLAREWRARA